MALNLDAHFRSRPHAAGGTLPTVVMDLPLKTMEDTTTTCAHTTGGAFCASGRPFPNALHETGRITSFTQAHYA